MADLENGDEVPKLTSIDLLGDENHVSLEEDSFTRPGAQLADKQTFTNKLGDTVTGYPVIVDFRRLLQLTPDATRIRLQEFGIIPGVSLK